METIRKLSDIELSEYIDLMSKFNELIEDYCHISLPLSVTNALCAFQLNLEKEINKREI